MTFSSCYWRWRVWFCWLLKRFRSVYCFSLQSDWEFSFSRHCQWLSPRGCEIYVTSHPILYRARDIWILILFRRFVCGTMSHLLNTTNIEPNHSLGWWEWNIFFVISINLLSTKCVMMIIQLKTVKENVRPRRYDSGSCRCFNEWLDPQLPCRKWNKKFLIVSVCTNIFIPAVMDWLMSTEIVFSSSSKGVIEITANAYSTLEPYVSHLQAEVLKPPHI